MSNYWTNLLTVLASYIIAFNYKQHLNLLQLIIQCPEMLSVKSFVVALTISYLLVIFLPSTTGAARASEVSRNDDNEKQWDMSFPYYLMMMSNSNTIFPSVWLIPVAIASCTMLYIRGTMDWM